MARSNRFNLEALEDRYNPSSIPTMDLSLVVGPNSEENHPSSATIVFVDSELLSKVPSAEWEESTLFPLYHDKDFVSQISVGLASGSKWDVVRLITHGSDGAVHLGSQEIDTTTLEVRSGEIAGWNQYLAPGADILLYGCNVAATEKGTEFVSNFAQLIHADMAASSDVTGLGGDEIFEVKFGAINSFSLRNRFLCNSYKAGLNYIDQKYDLDNLGDNGSVFRIDFNGDKKDDIISVDNVSKSIFIFQNNGYGKYEKINDSIKAYFGNIFVCVNDFNKDGNADISYCSSNLIMYVYFGNGKGQFIKNAEYQIGTIGAFRSSGQMCSADFNNDGYVDLAAVSGYDQCVTVFFNDKTGNFSNRNVIKLGGITVYTNAADINNDGASDFVVGYGAHAGSFGFSVLLSDSNGSFTIVQTLGNGTQNLELGDLNNDGLIDMVSSSEISGVMNIFSGNGNGTFTLKSPIIPSSKGGRNLICDFNNDGFPEIAETYPTTNKISIYKNKGNFSFEELSFDSCKSPYLLSLIDIYGDNAKSLVVGGLNSISIYKNYTYNTTSYLSSSSNAYTYGETLHLNVSTSTSYLKPAGEVSLITSGKKIATSTLDLYGNLSFDISGLASGTYTFFADYSGTESFKPSQSNQAIVNIIQKKATISANNINTIYGSALPALTLSIYGLVNGDTENSISGLYASTLASRSSPVGDYLIIPSGFNTNYDFSLVNGTLSVTKASLSILADNKSKIYGSALPTFTTTVSGLVNGDTASAISGLGVTTTATASSTVGNYSLKPTGTNANYDITLVDGNLAVTKAALSILADNKTKVYGSALPTFTTTVYGLVNGDTNSAISGLGVTTTATASSTVGNYSLKPTGTNANYDITLFDGNLAVTKAALSILADNKTKAYGSALPAFTTTVSGLVNGDTNSAISGLGATTTATASSGVGNYALKPTGSNANYDITLVDGNLAVTKAALSILADNKFKVYGAALPAFTTTVSGLVNGDTASAISGLGVTTTATASSGVGNYTLKPTGSNANYDISLVDGNLAVTKAALSILADNKFKVYGAALPTFTTTVSGLVNGDTKSALTGLGVTTQASRSSSVGTYNLFPTGTNPNYDITRIDGSLVVTKAALSILADNKTKVYGAALPLFTTSLAGLVNGDTEEAITNLGVTTPASTSSFVGNYTLRPTGSNTNYDITYVDGNLDVTKASLIIKAENQSYIRGLQAYPVFTYTISGFVNGDNVNSLNGSPELSSTAKEFSPFGNYPITVDVSKIGSNNYTLSGTNGVLSINKVAASIIPVESIPILTTTNGAANGITIWGAGGKKLGTLDPYPGYTGRIVTAVGDLNGDGVVDIITGVGAGTSPFLRRYDGRTLKEIGQGFYAYDKAFMGGMSVAAADVDGDGLCEIITGTGNGSAPHVKVRKMDGTITASFYAYAPEFTRGVNLITGDMDGDSKAEIVSTPNWGGGPHVKVFDGTGKASASFFAYESNFIGGFSLTLADTDGNGTKEIVTESYAGRITSGRVFDPKGKMLREWFPHGTISSGGMVIAADLNGDKIDEIVSVALPGSPSVLKVFDGGLKQTASTLPYGASYTNGISIKAVDLNADGIKEIVTAPRSGLVPQVRRFDGALKVLDSLFATATSFTGGIWLD